MTALPGGIVARLEVSGLQVKRGGRPVLEGIGFTLEPGEALAVTGRNGAGKSTLLRAVAGLVPREAGRIDWTSEDVPLVEATHYFGHLDALKPTLSTADNLALWSKVAGRPGLSAIEALEAVGLDHLEDLPAAYLSAGQRRRVAFARLLLVRRPLWLLDEPTAALDSQSESLFARLMKAHLDQGGLIIAATHQPLGLENAQELVMTGFDYLGEAA